MALTTQASNKGLQFNAQREAMVLTAHRDTKNLAIGVGDNAPDLKEGDTITFDEAVARYQKRALDFEADVNRVFGAAPLSQQMYDALFSLTYNIGGTVLRAQKDLISAVIAHALTPGDRVLRDKAAYLLLGVKRTEEGGPFNLSRRCKEALIFINGDYGTLDLLKLWPVGTSPRNNPPDPPQLVPMPVFR